MKILLLKNKWFLIPAAVFFIFTGIILVIFSKPDIHLFINQFHAPWADHFFLFMTWLGTGDFALAVIFVLLFIRFRYSLYILINWAVAGIVVQMLKNFVFPHAFRPAKYFEGLHEIYKVPGLDLNLFNSFPSGHSASAFAVFLGLSIILTRYGKKYLPVLLFLIALLIAYSRIYLSEHFLVDVYFGSLTGCISAMVFARPVLEMRKKWTDLSVIKLFSGNP